MAKSKRSALKIVSRKKAKTPHRRINIYLIKCAAACQDLFFASLASTFLSEKWMWHNGKVTSRFDNKILTTRFQRQTRVICHNSLSMNVELSLSNCIKKMSLLLVCLFVVDGNCRLIEFLCRRQCEQMNRVNTEFFMSVFHEHKLISTRCQLLSIFFS